MNKRLLTVAALASILTVVVASAPAQARPDQGKDTLFARLVLPSKRIVAGSAVYAKLRVFNTTGDAVTVTTCGSPFAVALNSKTYVPLVGWPACASSFTIPVGSSTYDLRLQASYSSCGGEGTIPGQGPTLPCIDGRPPALPVGKYQVKVYQNPAVVSAPAPINVRVVVA
jgi:hypothetical protein